MYTRVKTLPEIEAMRTGGRILAQVLDTLKPRVTAGISTKELNDIAAAELKALGAQAAFLGYQGFPESICISVNDEVVHGIPSRDNIIKDGDIVSLDFGVMYKGMITDAAISVVCGRGTHQVKDLLKYTEQSLYEGLSVIKNGCHAGDIGQAVQQVLDKHRYGIIRELVGHGVGHAVHEDPNIPNYGRKNTGPELVAGMTLAIEPMATLGREAVVVDPDGWTVRTRDGSWAAHFEHTVLVTDEGFEILTQV
jgi:methionyl aminopeptidase